MNVNFLFMRITTEHLEKVLEEHRLKLADFKKYFNLSKQTYRNWKIRGVPDGKILPISNYIGISVEKFTGAVGNGSTKGGAVTVLQKEKMAPAKLARILDEIQQYERENSLEFSNAQRAHLIKELYSRPDNIDYRAEIADIIELSKVLRRS
jgi:hypothetical protein